MERILGQTGLLFNIISGLRRLLSHIKRLILPNSGGWHHVWLIPDGVAVAPLTRTRKDVTMTRITSAILAAAVALTSITATPAAATAAMIRGLEVIA